VIFAAGWYCKFRPVVLQVVSSDLFEFHLETGIRYRADRKIGPFFWLRTDIAWTCPWD
jgi:hypothetical protein